MTNIWKRSISMLLALVMVVGMLPVQAFATETEQNTEETSVTEPVVIETTAPVVEETAEPSQTTEETSAPEPVPEETTAATESVAESTEATEAAQETTVPAETEAVTEETTEVTEETAAPVETEAAEEAVTEPVEETEPAQETQIVATRECYNVVPSVELPSDEELFAAYAEQQFYGEMAAFGTAAGRRLSGDEKLAYDALVPVIKQIASGERASAKIALGVSLGEVTFGDGSTGVYNADVEVAFNGTTFPGDSLHRVINALLTDLPYEMYWYDKTIGVSDMVIVADSQMHIVFEFAVAGPYMGSNLLTANTAKTGAAKTAAANAKAVVDSIAAGASIKTDYDKLIAYRDWICANVAYNTSAANGGNFSENADPWQMIYVFDGNSATNVVCEGYSKAFQYLCDLSEFEADITCYTVTGTMAGGTGAGGHMWNIVEIDGQHYLADVTNSDSGTVGDDGSLFLVGGTANNDGSYTFNGVHFIYDTDTQELWDGTAVLTLDTVNYEPKLAATSDAEANLRAALAATSGADFTMTESVVLTEDLTINIRSDEYTWAEFCIPRGMTLTVSSGVTLTLDSNMWIQGELILEDGATLLVGKAGGQYYSSMTVQGKLTAASGAAVSVRNNAGIYVGDNATISGVATNKLIREKTVSTLAELKSALTITGYQNVQIFVDSNLTVAETLTIPDGCSVYVMNDGKSFTIANGGHVIMDGFFSVQNGAVLNVNAGGTMTINGNAISYGGIINNNGTINGNFQINSVGGQELSEADFVAALENCYGFYNLADHVVITGDVTIPEDVTVWVTNTGSLTVAKGGKLTVNGQLSTGSATITVEGTLANNGFMSLDHASNGKIDITSTGALQNKGGLTILGGQLTLNGSYTALEGFWVNYDPQATITNITKIGTANIGIMDIVMTEGELRTALTKRNGYAYQEVYVNDDITLTSSLTVPEGVGLNVGYSWRNDEADQYGLTVASGVTLTNNSYINVNEKMYLRINSGAKLVNNGDVWVNGSYKCDGTATGNAVQVQGGSITQDEFEAKLEAAGGNWVQLTQALTLERDLTINSGFGVVGQGFLVVPNGVTLTINDQMSISSMVRVENGGKLVMGENAHINLDGAANLTFESNADISGLRKGHIHQNIDFGATVDGLDKSYIEMICAIYMPEDFEDALSYMEMGYHSGRFEVKSVLVLEDDVTLPANVILSAFEPTGQGVLEIHVLENFINKGSIEIGERTSLIVDGTMENQGNVNVYEGGSLQVAGSGTLINNGGLWNYGGTIHVAGRYENNGHVEGDVNVAGQMTQAELEAAMAECVANGNDWVQNTKVILDSDMTINLNDRNFCIAEGGAIIVPDGVTLHVNSYVTLNGGKLIILEGGTLRTTAPIDAQNGILFFQYDAMWNIQADIYGQRLHEVYGDIASSLAVYPCNDYGSGATADWNRPMSRMQIMPGMWSRALFCLREWDYVNYEWKNTVIRPDQLLGGQYLHVMALADTENPPMFAPGDANVENYVAVMAEKVFAESEVKFNHDGIDYSMPVTIGPGNHGFFSQPVATVENYLGFGYTIDPDAAENSFYYMFFGDKDGWKIDNFQVVNNPFDMQPVDQVTWTKVSDTVYKITVKPECWNQSFPVHVQVEVSNANFGMSNTWGIGQLWVEPFMSYDPWLGFVWLNNDGNGEGWYENPNDEPNRMDGMWAQDEFYGIFYMHQWDESKQLWVGTPVIPTATGDYVTITPVKNLPGHTIKAGQNHANYFVQVKGNGPLEGLSGGKLNFTCNGTAMSQDFNLYPCDVAWYDANETTLDAFISTGGAEVELDYSKAENAYYLKLLDTSKFTIRNFSWGVNTWGEDYDQYVSDGEFITMTDLGNGTFKFTLDPEYVAMTKYTWKNFCLYADVQYGSPSGMMNNNWHGELWINPPEGEFHEPDAELFIDGQIFAFFDGLSYPMRWEFTGDYDDQGREIMKLVKAELPAGVSYDLGSNKLRLNNATLQNLEVGYYWKDENGRPLPVEEFGSRVPNPNFFLELVGNNTINGQHDWAAILAHSGVNLNVVGNGTLTITGNGEGYPAIDITPEATACFQSGIIQLVNTNLWFGGIIDWDGTELIANNSYVNVDNMLTLDSGDIFMYGGAFRVNANMTMNGGSITLNDSTLYNGTAFTQNGGTITANNNAGRDPAIVVDCYYALNGGNINITQNDGLSAMAVWGTFHQMGGTVDIRGAKGITVATTWDNNGNVVVDKNGNKRVGSLLLNDGVMNITGPEGSRIVGIDVQPESSAYFGGGNLTLTNANICDGGEIEMTHMTDDSHMQVNLYNGDFYADNAFNLYDGNLYIENGIMIVNTATGIHGGRLVINNSGHSGINGLIVNNYFFLPKESTAHVQVTASGVPAIVVHGTYHQMGGTVFGVAQNGGQAPGILSNGATLLNGGNLYAIGEIGFEQQYNFDWNNPNGQPGMMITGGTMYAKGDNVGFWVKGPVMWNGGKVLAHTYATEGALWQSAVQVDRFTGDETENVSFLEINDGEHSLTADPSTTGRETYGLAIDFAPVTINGGMVNVDADRALWSLGYVNETNISSETGVVTYLSMDSGEYLDIHGELGADYWESLMENDGSYAGNVLVSVSTDGKVPMTQGRLEAMLREAAANGTGVVLEENLTLVRDLELNAHLTIKNNAELIVPAGVTLTNKEDRVLAMVSGGRLNVSGDLVNYGYLNVGEYQKASLNVNGTLTNYGVFRVFKDGTAEIGGYLKNIRPEDLTQQRGLVIAYGVLNAAEVYNSRWICAWGGTINITGRLENAGELSHDDGGKITVDTVMNYNDAILNVFNGHLTVTNVLNNNGELHANQGSVTVNGRYIHGQYAVVYNGSFDGTVVTIKGINTRCQTVTFNGNNATWFNNLVTEMGKNEYAGAYITINGNMNLPQNTTLGIGTEIWVHSGALTIPAGKTLKLYGNLVIEKTGAVTVQGELRNYGAIHVNGTLTKPAAGKVFNGTVMNVFAGGRVSADGENWTGYNPWKMEDGAIIDGTAMGMTQSKFEHALAEAERGEYRLELSQVVTLTRNLTINADVTIAEGGGIVVPKGITLTINGFRNSEKEGWFGVNDGGSLVVDGTLVNNASFWLYKGARMDVNGTVNNNKWFQTGRYPEDSSENAVLEVNGTFNNNYFMHLYSNAVMNVNKGAVLNGKYTFDKGDYRGFIHVDNGQMNLAGTLNNYLRMDVENGGVLNVEVTGTLKNLTDGNIWGMLHVGENALVRLRGTMVNNTNIYAVGNNAQFLTFPGSKLTNNGYIGNEGYDAIMDVSNAEYVHGTNAYASNTYFADGSVSTVKGIPNDKILLHLYETSEESVVNAMTKYGYDNGYLAQIVHYQGDNIIDEELFLQPGTELLVTPSWYNGEPNPGNLTLNANVEILDGAGIFVQQGSKLIVSEGVELKNRDRIMIWDGSQLIVNGMLNTYPGSATVAGADAVMMIGENATVINRQAAFVGEVGSHVVINGKAINNRGDMLALGTYELGENAEVRNSAFNGTISNMRGYQTKDLHLDAYFTEGATQANVTNVVNQIKSGGYRSAELFALADMTLNTLEIPANVTMYIGNEVEGGQVIPVTVTVNGQVTNMGKIQERKGGKLVMNGTLVGMPPVDEFGNSDFISQAELEEMLKEGGQVILEKSVFISGNLTIDNDLMIGGNGGELIVIKGATLTVNGSIHMGPNAALNVQAGGKLQNNGAIVMYNFVDDENPVVNVAGTYVRGITEDGENAVFLIRYSEENTPVATGIAKNYVALDANAPDEAYLREFFAFANGYGSAQVHIVEDLTLAENLTIPANGEVYMDSYQNNVTLTIPAGKTLTNNGKLIIYNGNLVVNGTILGNEPIVDAENTNIMTQSQFEQELAEAVANNWAYNLTKRVLITKDLTLGAKVELNIIGGELVITNNAKLTNNGTISTSTRNGGAIIVEDGSKFFNNANLYVGSDGVKMAPGSYVHGAQAMLYVDYTDSGDGYTVANVEGVDKSYQTLQFVRDGMWSALAEQFFQVAKEYRGGLMRTVGGMTVDQNLTVPEYITIRVCDGDYYGELVIENVTLINNGQIYLSGNTNTRVNGTLVNNGKLENIGSIHINGGVENNGQLINRGNIYRGTDDAQFFSVPGGITDTNMISEDLLIYRARVTTEAQLQSAAASGVDIIVIEQDMTLTKALTIPAGTEVIIPAGVTVTVNVNGAITNNGSVHMAGTLNFVKGNMQGNKVNVVGNGTVENAPEGSYLLVGVRPESFELGASMLVAPVNAPVELFVKNIKPIGADYVDYELEIVNSTSDGAWLEGNVLHAWNAGEVTVRAKLILSFNEYGQPVYSDITHDITVRFIIQGAFVTWMGSAFDSGVPMLVSGSNIVFTGEIRELFENAEGQIDVGELSNLTNTKLVWSLGQGDDAYATLTVNGNKATVTAKSVTERHEITLHANAADNSGWSVEILLSIRPKLEKVNLLANGMDVTGKTITYDVNGEYADLTMALNLAGTPADAYDPSMEFFVANNGYVGAANWTTSNENIATVENGNVVFTGETGTVKITATTNGSVKKSATVTINVIETPDYIEFVEPVTKLIGGQAVNYKLQGVFLDDNGEVERTETLLASAVKWGIPSASGTELVSGDSYVSINAQGKLTTKAVEAPHNVRVCAEYTIGDTVKRTFVDVVLYPAVNNVEVMESGKVVNGLTIFGDLDNYSHKTLSLKGYPADGSIKEVQWTSSNVKIAGFVNAEGELVNSITAEGDVTLAANADKTAGTITITATAIAHNGTKKAVTFKVTYGYFVKSIDVLNQDGNAVHGEITLASNGKMTLTAKTSIFGADGGDIDLASVDTFDLEQPIQPTNPKVTWKLANAADSAYLTVNNGVLTAKTINNPVTVDVVVVAQDGFGTSEIISVKLQPATVKVDGEATSPLLLRSHSAEGPYVTKTTVLVEYNKDNNKTLKLFAENGENVSWTSSNVKVATVDEAGVVTVVGKDSANITAKAADGRTAMVTIKGDKMSTGVKVEAKNSLEDGFVVASGKTLSLTGTVAYTDGTSDKNVTWTVTDRDGNATAAAKIAANGTLTATANLTEVTTVYVQAMAKDGAAVSDRIEVTIKPLATGVQISNAKLGILNNLKMTWDFGNNGTDKLQMNAAVFAENACQKVKWTSSNKAVASVDENTGLVTFHKAGNVTITATTTDGSNKKATVTMTVSKLMTSLELKSDASIVVMGGKSVKLAPYAVVDSEATNKKLTWTILEGSDFATINANTGELKAKNVTTVQRALVEVSAVDGSELAATTYVTIYPATTKVEIWKDGMEDITGQTIAVYDSNKLHLGAKTVPVDTMMFDGTAQWQWTSSDATGSIAVDQYGVVTVVGGGVTATITAKAMDGSNKTATIKIQSVQPVTEICFGEDGIPETQKLAGGLSLDLSKKVVFNNGGTQPTNKKLTWQVAEKDATYATINANGVLKANKIDIQKTITVIATATDGWTGYGEPVHAECEVELWPATTKVQILQGETDVTNKNVPLYLGGQLGMEQTTFGVLTTPNGAMQTMKWSIAAKDQQYVTLVNEWGEEVTECVGTNVRVRAKVGGKTINVTATTMDGTNKKATVRVQTFQLVNEIHMEDQILAGGLSLNLNTKASVNANATNKKLNWELVDPADKEFATLSNGTLKAVKRNDKAQPETVLVRATAADYGAYSKTITVTILPAITKLQIMNNKIDKTNQIIDLYLGGVEGTDAVSLNAVATPAAAMYETLKHQWAVKWTVAAKDQQYVTLVDNYGVETAEYVGAEATVKAKVGGKTITLTATSMDGTNKKATVRIKTTQLVTDMAIEDQILASNLQRNLTSLLVFNGGEANKQPTSKKVLWSLTNPEDTQYLTITNAANGTVKAKAVEKQQTVWVVAEAQDGSGVVTTCQITIYPATTKLQILNNGADKTNQIVDLYLSKDDPRPETTLGILTTPATAMQTVKWTVAAKDQQYVTLLADDGSETAEYVGANVTVKAKVGGKTVNVTAATMDGTNRKYTVRIRTTQLVTDMHIDDQILGVGRTLNLATILTYNRNADAQPTNKKVVWSLYDQRDAAYVTLNANNGSLKAVKLPAGQETHDVRIMVKAQDGSQVDEIFTVKLYPATTKLTIADNGVDVTNKTIKLFIGGANAENRNACDLNVDILPINAYKNVKWTIADKDKEFLYVDEITGEVAALKGGRTVAVTVTAQDGTNMRATVKIQTVQLMDDMNVVNQPVGNVIHVAAGKTMALKVNALPANTANKNVTWEIAEIDEETAKYVTLNAAGTLKVAQNLPKDMELTIRATAKDEGALSRTFLVKLYKQVTMSIRLTAPTTTIGVGHSLNLVARSLPSTNNMTAAQKWLWTSSNAKIATVDENGIVEAVAAGTVTITCKAVDGSGKTATIKITVTK